MIGLDETHGRAWRFEPGWRWSTDMPGSPLRPARSTTSATRSPADPRPDRRRPGARHPARLVYEIPPGHDAWVVGDEPFVTIDWAQARTKLGRSTSPASEARHRRVHRHRRLDRDPRRSATMPGANSWRRTTRVRDSSTSSAGGGQDDRRRPAGGLRQPARAVRCAGRWRLTRAHGPPDPRRRAHGRGRARRRRRPRARRPHAARVMALGGAGRRHGLGDDARSARGVRPALEDAGEHELKGLPGSRQVWRVVDAG